VIQIDRDLRFPDQGASVLPVGFPLDLIPGVPVMAWLNDQRDMVAYKYPYQCLLSLVLDPCQTPLL
jgi:hypothetical protein